MEKICGIYKITNHLGQIYIGQSVNVGKREQHYRDLRCAAQPKIFYSIMYHKWNTHKFEIIERCNPEKLNERELYWSEFYKSTSKDGLNSHKAGGAGGYRSHKELLRKLSEIQKTL